MKKVFGLIFFVTLVCLNTKAQYQSQNISLLSHWNDTSIPLTNFTGSRFAGVWGYADTVNDREYAILGGGAGTYFVEVTDPSNPVLRDYVPGRRDSCVWREVKTYNNYAYSVSDDGGENSLQIMDMSYLPDSVHVVYDDTTLFITSHTIWVEGDKLYCGYVRKPGFVYSMAVFSLANPELPVLLRTLNEDYPVIASVHDMYVRNDTVYASCGFDGFYIFKFNSNNTFSMIGSLTSYLQQGYNHSTSLTDDGKTLIMCDEVPESLAIKALDVADLGNISVTDTFRSEPFSKATGHNPYVVGNNRVVIGYYTDGVQVFDISDPSEVIRTGYFDTDTICGAFNDCIPGYHGCWGAYPFLPSGILLALDMQNGLFVLDASIAMDITQNTTPITLPQSIEVKIFPNPSTTDFVVKINSDKNYGLKYQLTDVVGKLIMGNPINLIPGENNISINTNTITNGIYFFRVSGDNINIVQKLLKE